MKADGGALQSSGTDYADVPVLSSDFRSSYVPVRTSYHNLSHSNALLG